MQRTPVESKTGMCGIAYDPAAQILEIAFKDRNVAKGFRIYHYAAFTQADWDAFLIAESKGSHFIKTIKPIFACTRMPDEVPDAETETKA